MGLKISLRLGSQLNSWDDEKRVFFVIWIYLVPPIAIAIIWRWNESFRIHQIKVLAPFSMYLVLSIAFVTKFSNFPLKWRLLKYTLIHEHTLLLVGEKHHRVFWIFEMLSFKNHKCSTGAIRCNSIHNHHITICGRGLYIWRI